MSRKPISVVKNVLSRNCSGVIPPPGADTGNENWCDWAPFGEFLFFFFIMSKPYNDLDPGFLEVHAVYM